MGSGLRPDVWRRFLERFGAIRIVETYGLTEGNVTLFNYTGTPGAVGRSSFIYKVLGALGGRGRGLGWGIPRPRPSILTPRSPALLALRDRALRRGRGSPGAGQGRALHPRGDG